MRKVTIGQRIRRAREDRYYTQEQLARDMNVSSQTVSRWERDLLKPQAEHRRRLAKRLSTNRHIYEPDDFAA